MSQLKIYSNGIYIYVPQVPNDAKTRDIQRSLKGFQQKIGSLRKLPKTIKGKKSKLKIQSLKEDQQVKLVELKKRPFSFSIGKTL